jgi:hypothetical protein
MTNHLSPQAIEHKPNATYGWHPLTIQVLDWDRVKPVNGIPNVTLHGEQMEIS